MIDPGTIRELESWLETCRGGDVLFMRGANPGIGISTLLHTLIDNTFESLWIPNGASKLKHTLIDAASSTISPLMRRKIFVFDPVDALFADISASADISEFARRGKCRVPIICAGFRMRFSTTRATTAGDMYFENASRVARRCTASI